VTEAVLSAETVFAPVRSQTAFEETVERLGTAIKLGLLPPGTRLPAERELCRRMGIARSTLRQALTALTQSGHVFATRGRRGGTFVSDPQPPAAPASPDMLARWRETCDRRLAVVYTQNDLGGAWARDGFGRWEHEVVPGGDDQREEAFRLGVNLVMYALCLDYKTEQAHIDYILRTRRFAR